MMFLKGTNFSVINILLIFSLLVLFFGQMYLLWKQNALSNSRKSLRIFLNIILFFLVAIWAYQPSWKEELKRQNLILKSEDVSNEFAHKIADSLSIKQIFNTSDFESEIKLHPDFLSSINSIYLIGQTFNPELLSRIVNEKIVWKPYFKQNLVQNLQWKGVLRKGESQEISGKIEVDKPKDLYLKFGDKIIDSIRLHEGTNAFKMGFSVFSLGKTNLELVLENKTIDTIRFFADKSHPFNVLLILENQDFESKILADYLAKNGHSVLIKTTVAKNTLSNFAINQKTNQNTDIVVTTPMNINHEDVKKAILEGKNVLFFNFLNPENEIAGINSTLGTGFKIKRLSNENEIKINEFLTSFPFEFIINQNQKSIKNLPIVFQKNKSKIGVSLLKQTFQMQLAGDSLQYHKTWNGIFEMLRPSIKNSFDLKAPILINQKSEIKINYFNNFNKEFIESPISSKNAILKQVFKKSGWQNLNDSVSIFVEEKTNISYKKHQIKTFMNAYNQDFKVDSESSKTKENQVPNWLWLMAFLICLTALWIEPKF